jgi:hypothetical protein
MLANASAAKKAKGRRLWASDRNGRFRTHGRDSVATVRGTEWITEDTCEGTRTTVVKGAVSVRDRHTGRTLRAPPVFMGPWNSGDLRLDPAPCWNRTGDALVVPGIAPDSTRQMFVIELREHE